MNTNEYYIEQDFATLSGAYSEIFPQEMAWMQSVINDLKAGGIEYRVFKNEHGYWVQRKGMILCKKKQ